MSNRGISFIKSIWVVPQGLWMNLMSLLLYALAKEDTPTATQTPTDWDGWVGKKTRYKDLFLEPTYRRLL